MGTCLGILTASILIPVFIVGLVIAGIIGIISLIAIGKSHQEDAAVAASPTPIVQEGGAVATPLPVAMPISIPGTARPSPIAAPAQRWAVLQKDFPFTTSYGTITIQAGTKLRVVSADTAGVTVSYMNSAVRIPLEDVKLE